MFDDIVCLDDSIRLMDLKAYKMMLIIDPKTTWGPLVGRAGLVPTGGGAVPGQAGQRYLGTDVRMEQARTVHAGSVVYRSSRRQSVPVPVPWPLLGHDFPGGIHLISSLTQALLWKARKGLTCRFLGRYTLKQREGRAIFLLGVDCRQ